MQPCVHVTWDPTWRVPAWPAPRSARTAGLRRGRPRSLPCAAVSFTAAAAAALVRRGNKAAPTTEDPIFRWLSKVLAKRNLGQVLDAGPDSLTWLARQQVESLTAVTACDGMYATLEDEVMDFLDPSRDEVLVGNWKDEKFLGRKSFDVVLADYLLGSVDFFAPYFQVGLLRRLTTLTKPGGLLILELSCDDPTSQLVMDVECFRDAVMMLGRQRPYREMPRRWCAQQLGQDFELLKGRLFPRKLTVEKALGEVFSSSLWVRLMMRLGKAQRAITVCTGLFAPALIYRSCFLSPSLPRRTLSAAVATSAFSTMSGAAAAPLTFLDSSNKEVPMAEAFKGKSVALYFAGEWCPMCTAFTPQLSDFLAKHGEKSAVLVSSDFTQEAYETHRGHLPSSMMAVPYGTELQVAAGGDERYFVCAAGAAAVAAGGDERYLVCAAGAAAVAAGGDERYFVCAAGALDAFCVRPDMRIGYGLLQNAL
eukprot:s2998_g4.t1